MQRLVLARERRDDAAMEVPSIGQLRKQAIWVWLRCANARCLHSRPLALTPIIIRWGSEVSSDMLRRCERCGRKGASITMPSWGEQTLPEQPFPVRTISVAY